MLVFVLVLGVLEKSCQREGIEQWTETTCLMCFRLCHVAYVSPPFPLSSFSHHPLYTPTLTYTQHLTTTLPCQVL